MEDLRRLGGILHAPLSARRILGARHSSLGICQTDYAGICSAGRKGKLLLKKKKKVLRARLINSVKPTHFSDGNGSSFLQMRHQTERELTKEIK
ncbi:hypothetical protein CDAR_211822 [Caerostris darwini]|uniref:Uncharacterized protein n=1 Tax=Caerostris darwini TaxID=1538125 RepID=A0AAV4PGG4_9ARAC|nr:hypothetical protein CDAR_211822 [Caerostris darwini]